MAKGDKLIIQKLASRSKSSQKVLDIERRLIDDLFQVAFLTFETEPVNALFRRYSPRDFTNIFEEPRSVLLFCDSISIL